MRVGLDLARRLEIAELVGAVECVDAYAKLCPDGGAARIAVGSGEACYCGAGSPLTHTIGLGMQGPVSAADLEQMDEFYRSRGTPASIDLCPCADASVFDAMSARGYRIFEFNNVLVAPVAGGVEPSGSIVTRVAEPAEDRLWAGTVTRGFFERDELLDAELEIALTLFHCAGAVCWLGFVDGAPAGGGAMAMRNGLALLYADGTARAFRGRGVQKALIRARMSFGASRGCDMITAATQPGTISQRNYESCGFETVYTRVGLTREWL